MPTRSRRHLFWLVPAILLLAPAYIALARTHHGDPQHDVLSCTGECSEYDQDLRSISLAVHKGRLLVTVRQYGTGPGYLGPFTDAQALYWPDLDLYTTSSSPAHGPDYPWTAKHPADYNVVATNDARNPSHCGHNPHQDYVMQLVHVSRKGWNAGHKVLVKNVPCSTPDANTIVYKLPLKKLHRPSRVRARAWQGGTSEPGSHRIVDVVPDGHGVVGIRTR